MRKRVILKNEIPASTMKKRRRNMSTFKVLAGNLHVGQVNVHAIADAYSFILHGFFYLQVSERFSNKQQTLLFSTKTDLIAHWQIHPCAKIMQMNEKTKTYYRNKFNLCGETPHLLP